MGAASRPSSADSTTQSFQSIGGVGSVAYANAMQVRLLAVPEPTQMVLVAGIGATLGAWRLRKLRRSREAAGDADFALFDAALDAFYGGDPDPRTLDLLNAR